MNVNIEFILQLLNSKTNNSVFILEKNYQKFKQSISEYYYYLTDEERLSLIENSYSNSCQTIAESFITILKEYNINSSYIFLYSEPFDIKFDYEKKMFNAEFLKVIRTKDNKNINNFLKSTIEIKNRLNNPPCTHAVVEIPINNEKWILDPTAGILYNTGKENLLRGKGIYESYFFNNQIDELEKSVHRGLITLYYASDMYWKSVYHLSYSQNGGLPVKKDENIIDTAPINKEDIYKKHPTAIQDNIAVFTNTNTRYIKNYDAIALKHLQGIKETGENPYGNKKYTEFTTKKYIQYINKYVVSNDYVLDAGVGMGDIMYNLSTPNKYGVDISIDYLKIAKNRNINVCLAMLEDLPYNDNSFDVVLCRDVLEHIFDLYNGIKNILRVLKKGGYLILQVPYKQDLTIFLKYTEFDFVHIRSFDEAQLIIIFEKVFECKCVEYAPCICDFEYNCDMIDVVIQKK